jgi:hypothetical protein
MSNSVYERCGMPPPQETFNEDSARVATNRIMLLSISNARLQKNKSGILKYNMLTCYPLEQNLQLQPCSHLSDEK